MYLTDEQVRDKLHEGEVEAVILNYLDFARYLADRMANKCATHERADLRAEAFLVLVAYVNKLAGHPNPGGTLRKAIRGHLINVVRREHLIRRPDGEKKLEGLVYTEDVGPSEEESEAGEGLALFKEYWVPFYPEGKEEEDRLVGSCFFSDIEKKVLKLKIDGFTLQEIAIQCQMPYVQTQRILQGTRSRVVKILTGFYE